MIGKCFLPFYKKNKPYEIKCYVTNDKRKPILVAETFALLKSVKRTDEVIGHFNNYRKIVGENSELFTGIGCLENPYHIKLKENTKSKVHPT